jgi:serine/threonine protein phosphatase 1
MWSSLFSSAKNSAASTSGPVPSVPEGIRIYATGDVHGRVDLLDHVLALIDADLNGRPVRQAIQVFLGDYIDRGPASREVVERLIRRGRCHEMIFLKGNHETYILEFLQNPEILDQWRQLGGLETLMSYGLRPSTPSGPTAGIDLAEALSSSVPKDHLQFLETLQSSFSCGDFFFVHAGVRPGTPLAQQSEDDLLSIRDDFLRSKADFGKIVVHGHTPVQVPDIRPNRINIDTGAYATGRLTCLVIERDELLFLTE